MIDIFEQIIELENSKVRLEPLTTAHFQALLPVAMEKMIWEFTSARIETEADFKQYFDTALQERQQNKSYRIRYYKRKAFLDNYKDVVFHASFLSKYH